jgi:hypothetical protein
LLEFLLRLVYFVCETGVLNPRVITLLLSYCNRLTCEMLFLRPTILFLIVVFLALPSGAKPYTATSLWGLLLALMFSVAVASPSLLAQMTARSYSSVLNCAALGLL